MRKKLQGCQMTQSSQMNNSNDDTPLTNTQLMTDDDVADTDNKQVDYPQRPGLRKLTRKAPVDSVAAHQPPPPKVRAQRLT
jgi:hypothetical protein